jgi:hypothetical protein
MDRYKLKLTDLIPVAGLVNHVRRCNQAREEYPILLLSEDYDASCFARDALLILYNAAIIGTAVSGLSSLLSK